MSNSRANDEWDDGGIPAVAVCARCGLAACVGCVPRTRVPKSGLPWERSRRGSWAQLWRTALEASLAPEQTFGEIRVGSVGRAFMFALVAETLALGSFAVLVSAGVWLMTPRLVRQIAASPAAFGSVILLFAGAVMSMLLLHMCWGACLDGNVPRRDAGPARAALSRGLRFGLYACGWDLLTSPIGLGCALVTRGPRAGVGAVIAAVRAPRLAQHAYLALAHGADRQSSRKAVRLAALAIAGTIAVILTGFAVAIALLARRLGY